MKGTKGKTSAKWIGLALFILLVIIGFAVHDDFGITVDEELQRRHGVVTWRYLNRKILNRGVFVDEATEDLLTYSGRYYGVILQMPLVIAEDVYRTLSGEPMSVRAIYLMRHAWVYLFFTAAMLCFYKILNDLFGRPLLSAAGVLMILVFGRYFADSCFNIKDSLFSSLTVINLTLAMQVIRSGRKTKWLIFYAVETACMVSSRIVGALYPLLFLVILTISDLRERRRIDWKTWLLTGCAYPLWLLFAPASWTDPIGFSLKSVKKFSDYNWKGYFIYDGSYQTAHSSPPEYFIRWIGMTVPLVFLALCLAGVIVYAAVMLKRMKQRDPVLAEHDMLYGIAFLVIGITLGYQALKHPTVYNGWRHAYYLYPLMILFAMEALSALLNGPAPAVLKTMCCVILAASIVWNGWETFSAPAFSYASYNILGRRVGRTYERDEWFIGNYSVMRWLADNTGTDEPVSVGKMNTVFTVFQRGAEMLPEPERSRISVESGDTDYIILRYDTPKSETAVQEGYEHIREFEAYGVKQYAVLKRIDAGE